MGLFDVFRSRLSIQECGIMNGAVDRHSHILFGVDDGIRTVEDSLAVLAFEDSLGVKEVWCTPHVMEDVPNGTEFLKARFRELCDAYDGPLKLNLAAEYMIDSVFEERLAAKDLLTMEDNMLLMETSTIAPPYDLMGSLYAAIKAGYHPLFAHPERCRFLDADDCEEFVNMGVRLQLNMASVTGYYGETARMKAEALLKKGLYSAFGSDCHRVKAIRDQYSWRELKKTTVQDLFRIMEAD